MWPTQGNGKVTDGEELPSGSQTLGSSTLSCLGGPEIEVVHTRANV